MFSINDDALRKALTFLSVAEGRRGLGETSKALRALVGSTALERTRFSESYVLRGNEHGIVHALATSCGTKLWPTRLVRRFDFLPPRETSALPPGVTYRISRVKGGESNIDNETYGPGHPPLQQKLHGLFEADLDPNKDDTLSTGSDCHLDSGGILIKLPLQLRASHFRIGFGNCGSWTFRNWVFEAYDGDGHWTGLAVCSRSPWSRINLGEVGPEMIFQVNRSPNFQVVSSRFRIRLLGIRCMHVRSFELFGTILPRPNPDPEPPSPAEAAVHTSEVLDDN